MAESELISKKELLRLTGISYGQLYRWKRKNLIPEEWFIRKSTFTGQETFFPKQQILSRIERIQNMKDGLSLDEIADQITPLPDMVVPISALIEQNIVSKVALEVFLTEFPRASTVSFEQVLWATVLDQLLQSGAISTMEGSVVLRTLDEHYAHFAGKGCDLVFIRKLGVSTCLLMSSAEELRFESGAKVVSTVSIAKVTEELHLKMLTV